MYSGYSNAANNNIFYLLEALLITTQFFRWDMFEERRNWFPGLQVLFVLFWLLEVFLFSLFRVSSYFIIFHSFVIVLLSINMINKIVFRESHPLLQHPVFLICMGFIAYFTYAVLVEAFWIFGLTQSRLFRLHIHELLAYINLFVNLLFALAVIWIPMRQQYILQS